MRERKLNIYYLQGIRNSWKSVNEECLNENDRKIFLNRKRAVDMYIEGFPIKDITDKAEIHASKIHIFAEKCLKIDEKTGNCYGYTALIPHRRIKRYERISDDEITVSGNGNHNGSFGKLLVKYPTLQTFIYNNYFGKDSVSLEKNVNVKTLYCKFIEECRKLKIQDYEYPFNTKDKASRTFYKYIKKMVDDNANVAINRESINSKQRFNSTGVGQKHRPIPIAPFSMVQLDGHKIDMLYTVQVENKHGEIMNMPAIRMWLIAVIDVATRTILGYSLSTGENYNQTDVLRALRNSMVPKERMEFTIGKFEYPENGGYASISIPETEWAMFDSIMLDNAKSHLAHNVIDKLCSDLMCSVNFGSVATPETRGIIERLFETLEENGYHRLPSTTGSNINDNRRKNAEKDAAKYQITYHDITQMTEYFIALYNNSAHSYLDNQTPLQCMERRITEAGMLPSIANEHQKAIIASLTNRNELKTVRGSYSSGKRPYVSYKGVEYRNDVLSYSMGLIGQKIMLEINPDDIRTIKAYFADGSELGILTAVGEWGRKSHSLKTREEAMKLANINKQKNNRFYAPLTELEKQLTDRAETDRRARTKAESMKNSRTKEPEQPKKIINTDNVIEMKPKYETYTQEELDALLSADSIEDAYKKGLF